MRDRAAWKKLGGLSVTGFIVVLFITVLVFIFGMKLIPAYIEYATAKKAIDAIARDRTGASSPQEARRLFDTRAVIDNITGVKGSDLEITKDGGGLRIAVAYGKEVPLVSNVGLYIDFAANSAGQ